MTRSHWMALTAGTLIWGAAGAASAQSDDYAAPIVGGDSSLFALTGFVNNPEAYTQGIEHNVAGLSWVNITDLDGTAWLPSFLVGIDDSFEVGAFGSFADADNLSDTFGASVKWKFYDENTGTKVATADRSGMEGGFPSMATWYTVESNDDVMRHRLGLTASYTFTNLEEGDEEFNNTSLTGGAVYNFVEADNALFSNMEDDDFDWYVGINFQPALEWSVVVEYESDDDFWRTDGFAGAVRYHFNADSPEDTQWTVQAGVQNQEDILVGVQMGI